MSQNRKPPAYQEYAASILSNRTFRQMSLASRGLVWSMRLECWENKSVPASPFQLSRTLGYQHDEINDALSTEVKSFFQEKDGVFISLELENYRTHLEERRDAQSEGGKKGAAMTNAHKKSGNPRLTRRGASESLVKSKPKKQNLDAIDDGDIPIGWVSDYEDGESSEINI